MDDFPEIRELKTLSRKVKVDTVNYLHTKVKRTYLPHLNVPVYHPHTNLFLNTERTFHERSKKPLTTDGVYPPSQRTGTCETETHWTTLQTYQVHGKAEPTNSYPNSDSYDEGDKGKEKDKISSRKDRAHIDMFINSQVQESLSLLFEDDSSLKI